MECCWGECCPHPARVQVVQTRPCGHLPIEYVPGGTPTCPGHAEAVVGTDALDPSTCHVCGEVNRIHVAPETVRPINQISPAWVGDQ